MRPGGPLGVRQTGRDLQVVVATAPVVALALVAVTVAQLPGNPAELGSNLISDPGVRGGYVVGLGLCALGPLAFLRQALRLGAARQERHLAALRVVGATPGQARLLAARSTALPALVGGVLGVLLFLGLRHVAGGVRPGATTPLTDVQRELRVVPTTVAPSWWQVALVVLGVCLVAALAGASTAGPAVRDPLGTARRVSARAPRPWSLLLLVPAGVVLWAMVRLEAGEPVLSQVLGSALVVLLALAFLGLGPSVAHRAGRWLAARASSPVTTLAAARLVTDPRAAGRAAATVGTVSLAAGLSGWLLADVDEAMYVVPVVLVLVVLALSLGLVALSLGAHGTEAATERRRAFAALSAQGVEPAVLVRAHRREAEVVVLPLALVGVLAGLLPIVTLDALTWGDLTLALGIVLGVVATSWVSALASTALVRPAVLRACDPVNLRNG